MEKFSGDEFIKTTEMGSLIYNGMSNFNKHTNQFSDYSHAMHVDAYLVGKYFKKVCLRSKNATHIDSKVVDAVLDPTTGNIKSVKLEDGRDITGDFFIDCSGFRRILMNKLESKWVSYQKELPNNSAIPFLKEYEEGEYPDPSTQAWALSSGWMWTIPLLERTGNGYVFSDEFITPEKALEEIESKVGKNIKIAPLIKFNTGRQESAWVKNCITIGLASAFIEPLEATSIHSTIVQIKNFVFEYLRPTVEETVNSGSQQIYNQRTRRMFDDLRDFLVMHYMGGRDDSEYWRYISSGATQTEFVSHLLEMSKHRMPSNHDFPTYYGSAGWPLYSYVLAGIGRLSKDTCSKELNFQTNAHGDFRSITIQSYYDTQAKWDKEQRQLMSWKEFIDHFRTLKKANDLQN
jgi:tryptophan halogenase